MLEVKLNVVNKKEYEENQNYREVVIRLPKNREDMHRDLNYLDLDHNNLSIQDTHVTRCEFIDANDPMFSSLVTTEIDNIIIRASDSGYTSPFQEMKKVFEIFSKMSYLDRDKAIAILKLKQESITNLQDTIKYLKNINEFDYYPNAESSDDFARIQIENGDVYIDEILDYIDLDRLGDDQLSEREHKFTESGLIVQVEDELDLKEYEEEEEFE